MSPFQEEGNCLYNTWKQVGLLLQNLRYKVEDFRQQNMIIIVMVPYGSTIFVKTDS